MLNHVRIAGVAAVALALAGCGSSGGNTVTPASPAPAVLCPEQTQGRTGGDAGCTPAPKPAQTQGRTK